MRLFIYFLRHWLKLKCIITLASWEICVMIELLNIYWHIFTVLTSAHFFREKPFWMILFLYFPDVWLSFEAKFNIVQHCVPKIPCSGKTHYQGKIIIHRKLLFPNYPNPVLSIFVLELWLALDLPPFLQFVVSRLAIWELRRKSVWLLAHAFWKRCNKRQNGIRTGES